MVTSVMPTTIPKSIAVAPSTALAVAAKAPSNASGSIMEAIVNRLAPRTAASTSAAGRKAAIAAMGRRVHIGETIGLDVVAKGAGATLTAMGFPAAGLATHAAVSSMKGTGALGVSNLFGTKPSKSVGESIGESIGRLQQAEYPALESSKPPALYGMQEVKRIEGGKAGKYRKIQVPRLPPSETSTAITEVPTRKFDQIYRAKTVSNKRRKIG